MRVNIAFRVFLNDKYLTEGIAARTELDEIKAGSQVDELTLDSEIKIPDMPGQMLSIESESVMKRTNALQSILTNIQKLEGGGRDSPPIDMMAFVPEGLVSLCIGHKGRLVQKIRDETQVSLVVN